MAKNLLPLNPLTNMKIYFPSAQKGIPQTQTESAAFGNVLSWGQTWKQHNCASHTNNEPIWDEKYSICTYNLILYLYYMLFMLCTLVCFTITPFFSNKNRPYTHVFLWGIYNTGFLHCKFSLGLLLAWPWEICFFWEAHEGSSLWQSKF